MQSTAEKEYEYRGMTGQCLKVNLNSGIDTSTADVLAYL
jgi:hypothetical protein